jgi:hypothetical protein
MLIHKFWLGKWLFTAGASTAFIAAAQPVAPIEVENVYVSLFKIGGIIVTVATATWIISKKIYSLESVHEQWIKDRADLRQEIFKLQHTIEQLPCRDRGDDCHRPKR